MFSSLFMSQHCISTMVDVCYGTFPHDFNIVAFTDWVCWSPFPHTFIKLNVNGSSLGKLGRAVIKGLLRDDKG